MVAVLDAFLPRFDVRERHAVTVDAPADVVMEVARTLELGRRPVVRAIFAMREWLMHAHAGPPALRGGLVDETRRLGWGCLLDQRHRAYAAGAACQP